MRVRERGFAYANTSIELAIALVVLPLCRLCTNCVSGLVWFDLAYWHSIYCISIYISVGKAVSVRIELLRIPPEYLCTDTGTLLYSTQLR